MEKSNFYYSDRCGVRTHEAYAEDLKSPPFDHSGNLSLYKIKKRRCYTPNRLV